MFYVITGATGHIGSALVDSLAKNGEEVIALVRDSSDYSQITKFDVQIVECKLSTPESYRHLLTDAIVIHLAADTTIGISKSEKINQYYTNVTTSLIFLETALEVARHVIYLSTRQAYFPKSKVSISEQDQLNLYSNSTYYGFTKAVVHQRLREMILAKPIPLTILTPGLVYSDRLAHSGVNFIFSKYLENEIPILVSPHTQTSFTYLPNLVEAILRVANTVRTFGQEYNICNGQLSLQELFRQFAIVSDQPVPSPTISAKFLLVMYPALKLGMTLTRRKSLLNRESIRHANDSIVLSNQRSIDEISLEYADLTRSLNESLMILHQNTLVRTI